jgi:hypothetical protein
MTSLLQEVLAEMRELLTAIDEAAGKALHAQEDAREAHAQYVEATRGTSHPDAAKAVTNVHTAAQKAGKTARLLAEAANAYADYINTIAPGTVPARHSAPDAMPDGERLLAEADERGSRADAFWRRQAKKADDTQDSAENAEKGFRAYFTHQKNLQRPSGVTVASTAKAEYKAKDDGSEVDNPIAALAMGVASVAVAVKAYANHRKKQQQERKDTEQ